MTASVVKPGMPLWVVRGPGVEEQSQKVSRGVLMRSVMGDPGDPIMVVLGWEGAEPPEPTTGDIVRVMTTQVRAFTAPQDPDGELPLGPDMTVLVTVFKVGHLPADELLALLDEATDHFLSRFPNVHEVAFAKSSDERWVVEVLRTASVEGMRAIQADPEMSAHIKHMGASAASMEPTLNHVERVFVPSDE